MLIFTSNSKLQSDAHLASLDGFRACLALWVFLGHLAEACGYSNRLLSLHPLAVDLFMVLSGFLMIHTWKFNNINYKYLSVHTLKFYVMRFFRIAPLYYFLLLFFYLSGAFLSTSHDLILKTFPPLWAQNLSDFNPNTHWGNEGWYWLLFHLSFLFGIMPGMENSTALPDWSLSLEMQFYFVFPFFLIFLKKFPLLFFALFTAGLSFISPKLFGNYLDPGSITHFGQPSFLPYRINIFFAGMLAALLVKNFTNIRKSFYIFCLSLICLLPSNKIVILLYLFFVLICYTKIPIITYLLSLKIFNFLGKVSYSLYLSHIFIVYITLYFLISHTFFSNLLPLHRFILSLIISLPIVILLSSMLYKFIELPTLKFGKKLTKF